MEVVGWERGRDGQGMPCVVISSLLGSSSSITDHNVLTYGWTNAVFLGKGFIFLLFVLFLMFRFF